jgi:CheY-like chemotaxis protein
MRDAGTGDPRSEEDPGAPGAPELGEHVRYRVLVIDDHRDVVTAVSFVIAALGHEVRMADDGVLGLATLLEFEPDLVLVDLVMPGIDGWSLARAIRRQRLARQPRLVAISGRGSDVDQAASAAAGFEMHLVKPIRLVDLQRVLGEHLN